MLSKLLKYEFRATARVFLPLYAVLLVMSAVARLLYGAQMNQVRGTLVNILTVVVTVVVVGLLAAVGVVTLFLICRRFWNNLLGREGYLMNVLPVTSAAHVWSKLIAAAVWTVLSGVFCVVALFIMLSRVADFGSFGEFAEGWREFWQALAAQGVAGQARMLLIQLAVLALLSLLSSVLSIYTAMCIGQLANKHRIWASVGAYFGIGIVKSVIFSRVVLLRAAHYAGAKVSDLGLALGDQMDEVFNDIHTALPAINTEVMLNLGLNLLICAVLFFVTQWLLKRHLNLQ